MIVILVIESGKINKIVIVSYSVVGVEGFFVYLVEGEKIKLKDLVYGLMFCLGNDVVVVIVEFVGGSEDGFVYLMNKKVEEIGMINIIF